MEKRKGEIIERNLLDKIKTDKKIIAAIVFGSFLNQERYNDIDVCLVLDKGDSRHSMFDKRLRYLGTTKKEFDVQIFQQLPLYVRVEILRQGKVVFCNDIKKLYDVALATIKEFEYFKTKYQDYISRELLA